MSKKFCILAKIYKMKLKHNQAISGIYMIKNFLNGKVYIGKTVNLYRRKHQHFKELRKKEHKNFYLQNSFNKYGIKNFEFIVIEYADIEFLSKSEYYWCEYFKSYERKYGYNLDIIDINGLSIRSYESIVKQKKTVSLKPKLSRKGSLNHSSKKVYQYDLNGFFIKEHESCHIAAEFLGDRQKFSAISHAARKKLFRYKYQWRYEYLEKIDKYDINLKKEISKENGKITSKKIMSKNIKNGEILIFNSISEASKILNIGISNISRIAKGERKISKKLNMTFLFI
jgi:group I intron endonuclease